MVRILILCAVSLCLLTGCTLPDSVANKIGELVFKVSEDSINKAFEEIDNSLDSVVEEVVEQEASSVVKESVEEDTPNTFPGTVVDTGEYYTRDFMPIYYLMSDIGLIVSTEKSIVNAQDGWLSEYTVKAYKDTLSRGIVSKPITFVNTQLTAKEVSTLITNTETEWKVRKIDNICTVTKGKYEMQFSDTDKGLVMQAFKGESGMYSTPEYIK